MSEPLVSIIIPTYNRAFCLPRTVDSALNQTRPNVEVIIVDDGSTDNTAELVRQRYGNDNRVRYVPQSNSGVTVARNRGLSMATGDFVALLDSDDVWKPWKLEIQLACFEKNPDVGMIWTDMDAVDPNGKMVSPNFIKTMYGCYDQFTMEEIFSAKTPLAEMIPGTAAPTANVFLHTGDVYPKMFFGSLVHTSTVLIRRERFDMVKAFDEELSTCGEDYDFHCRTCEPGPVGFINVASIDYQIGAPDQLTNKQYHVFGTVNTLKTINKIMRTNRKRINFPRMRIRQRYADVHAWIGEIMLDFGHRGVARKHLFKSVVIRPWQPRTVRLLALTLVPKKIGESARVVFRQAKRLAGMQSKRTASHSA